MMRSHYFSWIMLYLRGKEYFLLASNDRAWDVGNDTELYWVGRKVRMTWRSRERECRFLFERKREWVSVGEKKGWWEGGRKGKKNVT